MNKLVLFALLFFVLSLAEGAGAQTVTFSRTRTLEKPRGEDVFVRFFGNNGDMLVYNRETNTNSEVFTCRITPGHPSANRYVIPSENNMYGGVKYRVTDMEIVGQMCYFCGQKSYFVMGLDMNGYPYMVPESRGFVGQISLDHMTDAQGSTAHRMTELSFTKEVTRIDARIDPEAPADTLLALVGKSLDNESCLVFSRVGSSPWDCWLVKSSDATECFTDVVFTDGEVVAASRFEGEHYLFGLRGALLADVANNDYTDLNTVYTFNTSNMLDYNLGINTTWHTDDVDIRLSASSGRNMVNVAYESFAEEPVGLQESFTTLFRMQVVVGADMQIIYLQNVRSGAKGPGALTDMLTMDELEGVALLHRDMESQPPTSIVQVAPWGVMGSLYSYASGADYEMTSLDKYAGKLLWAAGHQPNHQDSVVLFHQNMDYPLSGSCYTMPNYQRAELYYIEKSVAEQIDVIPVWCEISPKSWSKLYALPTLIPQRCRMGNFIIINSEDETETE